MEYLHIHYLRAEMALDVDLSWGEGSRCLLAPQSVTGFELPRKEM